MPPKKTTPDHSKLDRVVAEARRAKEERESGYREQALKLYPWICGRCAREFNLKTLRELTVHHKNHNHDDNPTDGSNWELLCLYCHDEEHRRHITAGTYGGKNTDKPKDLGGGHKPFADLAALLKK